MYKSLIIITLLAPCLSVFQAQAQRYLPRQKGLQITAGTVNGFKLNPLAFHAGAAFSFYTKHGNRWVFGSEYLEKRYRYKDLKLPQTQFTAEAGYYLKLFSGGRKTFFFSLGASVLLGYETVNWNKKKLADGATINHKDGFLYGGALTVEAEIFITDWLVVLVNVRERVLGGSSVGLFYTQPGIGLKFIIN